MSEVRSPEKPLPLLERADQSAADAIERDREHGKGWSDPEERKGRPSRIGQKKTRERSRAMRRGMLVAGEKVQGTLAYQVYELGPRRRRVLDAMMDGGSRKTPDVANRAGVSISYVKRVRREPVFNSVFRQLIEAAFPGQAARLQHQILEDALEPLEDCEPEKAAALVKTREQAAAFLGVPVKPPSVNLSASKKEVHHKHTFDGLPVEAKEEWAKKGTWDDSMREKYGPPPWER